METLLPWRSPRSDDLERGEPGPPLHPITGTFADATHAKDFAARCFRLAFPLHAVLLVTFAAGDTYYLFVSTAPSITRIAFPWPIGRCCFSASGCIAPPTTAAHSSLAALPGRCLSAPGPWPPPSIEIGSLIHPLGRAPRNSALRPSLASGPRWSTHRMGSASRTRPPSHWCCCSHPGSQ